MSIGTPLQVRTKVPNFKIESVLKNSEFQDEEIMLSDYLSQRTTSPADQNMQMDTPEVAEGEKKIDMIEPEDAYEGSFVVLLFVPSDHLPTEAAFLSKYHTIAYTGSCSRWITS